MCLFFAPTPPRFFRSEARGLVLLCAGLVLISAHAFAAPCPAGGGASDGGAPPASRSGAAPSRTPQKTSDSSLPVARARPAQREVARVDSLFSSGALDSAISVSTHAVARALAAGDTAAAGRLLTARARAEMSKNGPEAALPLLSRAVVYARASADSGGWMNALGFTGVALGWMGNTEASRGVNRSRLDLSRRTGDRQSEAWALTSLGYLSLRSGDADSARAQYRRAAALFATSRRDKARTTALIGLGRAQTMRGEYEKARRIYNDALRIAARTDDWRQQSDALNNLGTLAFRSGEMDRAAAAFERAFDINSSHDNARGTLIPATNVARARAYLGEFTAAADILDRAIRSCRRLGFADRLGMLEAALGNVRLSQGRLVAATLHFHRALALPGATAYQKCDAALGMVYALERVGRPEDAIVIADSALASGITGEFVPSFLSAGARCRRRLGRVDEALGCAVRAQEAARDLSPFLRIQAEIEVGMAHAALRHDEGARSAFYRAAALADTIHAASTEYRWRENGGQLRSLVDLAAATMLSEVLVPGDAPIDEAASSSLERGAFKVIQRLKARTLLERAVSSRPHAADSLLATLGPVTAHALQTRVLRPGELLVDITMGNEYALAFAVSPDTFVWWELPGERSDLPERIDVLASLAGTRPSPGESGIPEATARDVFSTLLGPALPFISTAHRLLVAPDGCTSDVPFALLDAHGMARAARPGGASMRLSRTFRTQSAEVIPSAALLVWQRRAVRSTPPEKPNADGVLVCAREIPRLRGVAEETDALAKRCNTTRATTPSAARAMLVREGGWTAIHAAGHIEVDAERPWRSGLVLDAPGDSLLRAQDIAPIRLRAAMAFLSGCESARGRASAGEGVLGLSSAFLVAGVPAVVATLWPVDDAATARFVTEVYDALSVGASVSTAVSMAQQAMRARPETAHPFYWAGFVVIGDGSRKVPVSAHAGTRARTSLLVVILLVMLVFAWMGFHPGLRPAGPRRPRGHHTGTFGRPV